MTMQLQCHMWWRHGGFPPPRSERSEPKLIFTQFPFRVVWSCLTQISLTFPLPPNALFLSSFKRLYGPIGKCFKFQFLPLLQALCGDISPQKIMTLNKCLLVALRFLYLTSKLWVWFPPGSFHMIRLRVPRFCVGTPTSSLSPTNWAHVRRILKSECFKWVCDVNAKCCVRLRATLCQTVDLIRGRPRPSPQTAVDGLLGGSCCFLLLKSFFNGRRYRNRLGLRLQLTIIFTFA